MKNKGLIIIFGVLFALSLAGGILGLLESKKEPKVDPAPEEKEEIAYIYYLEDVEVTDMPVNTPVLDANGLETENIEYLYASHTCTNKITGTFDEETWQFVPDEVKDGTCKIYFVKAKYEVSFVISNGETSEDNPTHIERGQNGTFVINPTEGYEFESSSCSDEKESIWDAEKNQLSISTIMKDVACKVVFKIKSLKMDVTVKNGEGNTTETVEYGQSASAIVSPKQGYENPTISCTNNQKATFENNKITIYKLTDNTSCTVTFKEVPTETFKLTVSALENIDITNGSSSQDIKKGDTGSFTLKAKEGFEIESVSCGGVVPNITQETNGTKYTFQGMEKDISCSVTVKRIATE